LYVSMCYWGHSYRLPSHSIKNDQLVFTVGHADFWSLTLDQSVHIMLLQTIPHCNLTTDTV